MAVTNNIISNIDIDIDIDIDMRESVFFCFTLQSEDVKLITRERDELQSMLDRFEKHMIEIQSNVKLLTAERDKLNVLYEQSQDELNKLRREAKHTLVSQSHVEEERDIALADFRRVMAEKEGLREKLKVSVFWKFKSSKYCICKNDHLIHQKMCVFKKELCVASVCICAINIWVNYCNYSCILFQFIGANPPLNLYSVMGEKGGFVFFVKPQFILKHLTWKHCY
uniref:Uncharacterized protein n=1 Tax=Pelusios castaneus TaxID=367368 RepID=A0A8C8RK96_9SAUR